MTFEVDPALARRGDRVSTGPDRSMEVLFKPRSVAVLGASADRTKAGSVILRSMMASGVEDVYPVNPKHDTLEGLKCYPTVLSIPDEVDLAIICVPAKAVPAMVRDCSMKGVRGTVIISSGFSELGTNDGHKLYEEVEEAWKCGPSRLLGPNTMGYCVPPTGMDVMFMDKETFPRPRPGGIAIISQSGSLGVSFMEELHHVGCGLSMFVGLGNILDIDECDVIEAAIKDPNTRCIALYLENVTDGERLVRTCRRCPKPIIALKGGRSEGGGKAATLHTGRIGGTYRILKDILRQSGVIEAHDEVELIDYARAFSQVPTPKGERVLVLTNGGGNGIVAADILEGEWGSVMRLAPLKEELRQCLKTVMPEYITPSNPVDLGAQSTGEDYLKVLEAVAKQGDHDLIIVGITSNRGIWPSLPEGIGMIARRYQIPIVAYLKGNGVVDGLTRLFSTAGIPAYPSVRRAVNAAAMMIGHRAKIVDKGK